MRRRAVVPSFALALALTLAACTHSGSATPGTPSPSASRAGTPGPPGPYGGQQVVWPARARAAAAPPALGAVVTTARAPLRGGSALPAGMTLARVGGTDAEPLVLTPCENRVQLTGGFRAIPPSSPGRAVVVVDAGHGGIQPGAVGPDGTAEKTRNLQVAQLVARELAPSVYRVVLTRTNDRTTRLGFRVALADALGAALAVSIHFNAGALTTSAAPGTETFGSIADPNGRRAAGVMFEAERRYLDTLVPSFRGRWAANPDAGARYRIGSNGDYYRQLRTSHVTWVISESLFISNAPEARLLARAAVREGLARSIAGGVRDYLFTQKPGSGWREPLKRGDPDPPPEPKCSDPVA
jgi:N-acetylmuramoyl-L-alanine amidase